jgi:hypothetical protein
MRPSTGPVGLRPAPFRRSPFPARPYGFPPAAVAHNFRRGFILSCASCPLQSPFELSPALRLSAPGTSRGVACPLRGINRRSPLPRASQARCVPSSTFLTSPTVSSSTDLAGLFHPATTSRVRSPGVFPRAQPYELSLAVALVSFPQTPCQGFLPSSRNLWPPSGPSSVRESVARRSCLGHDPPDPLLSFALPRVFLRPPRETISRLSPPTAFLGPRRVDDVRPGLPFRACLPVRGSRPVTRLV